MASRLIFRSSATLRFTPIFTLSLRRNFALSSSHQIKESSGGKSTVVYRRDRIATFPPLHGDLACPSTMLSTSRLPPNLAKHIRAYRGFQRLLPIVSSLSPPAYRGALSLTTSPSQITKTTTSTSRTLSQSRRVARATGSPSWPRTARRP